MATLIDVINLPSPIDFFNNSLLLLKKDRSIPLQPHEMLCLHEKFRQVLQENLLEPGIEKIRERFYKKFFTRAAESAQKWLTAHPNFENDVDQSLMPDAALYGEFSAQSSCLSQDYQLITKNSSKKTAFDQTLQKVMVLSEKICAQLPQTYGFHELDREDVRLLNFFSPDFPDHLKPHLLKRVWRCIVAVLRRIILTIQCNALSSLVRDAAIASKSILTHMNPNDRGEEPTTGWQPFLEQISALFQHFYPDKKSVHFEHQLLFFYRFLTHPSNIRYPNNDLDLFNKLLPNELPLTSQTELASFRRHLLQMLPEIQDSLIQLRTLLSSSYERCALLQLFSFPSKAALQEAVDRFASSYFQLVKGHTIAEYTQSKAVA